MGAFSGCLLWLDAVLRTGRCWGCGKGFWSNVPAASRGKGRCMENKSSLEIAGICLWENIGDHLVCWPRHRSAQGGLLPIQDKRIPAEPWWNGIGASCVLWEQPSTAGMGYG